VKHKLPESIQSLFVPSLALLLGLFMATSYSAISYISAAGVGQGSTLSDFDSLQAVELTEGRIVSAASDLQTAQIIETLEPAHGVASVIQNDPSPAILFALIGITLGYCASLYLIYRKKKRQERSVGFCL